jgi:hypothetical protein
MSTGKNLENIFGRAKNKIKIIIIFLPKISDVAELPRQ